MRSKIFATYLALLLFSVNAFALTAADRLLAVTNAGPSAGVINATCNGTLTTSGDYKICDYTTLGASTWVITSYGSGATYQLLAVGGGGPGGGGSVAGLGGGGGGGGGGVCEQAARAASVGTFNLSVGDGQTMGNALNGEDSTFDTVTAKGGGWGATSSNLQGNGAASNGGSGGGGSPNANTSDTATAGTSTQSTPSGGATCYGYAGGIDPFTGVLPGGGGGGAGGVGVDGSGSVSGAGGPGRSNSITGSAIEYGCGGGSGGGGGNGLTRGLGGCSNAGDGGDNSNSNTSGAANTGAGSGGKSVNASGIFSKGGSGRVVVKWKFQ